MSMEATADARPDYLRWIGFLLGPMIFTYVLMFAPSYLGLGIMFWLSVYWACGVMPVIYTAAIPILGFSLMGVDIWTILQSFVHPALILIVGPTLAIVAAAHCGLADRAAHYFISKIGTRVRTQLVFWLLFCTIISDFAADVVCALAFTPIVMRLLARAGYDSIEKVAANRSAMLMVIAVAIGSSLGGILTPMAGGQAAITWAGLNKVLGGEVTALSFTLRMFLPTTVCLGIVCGIFVLLAPKDEHFNFYADEHMYPLTRHEKVVAVIFLASVLLPFARPWLPMSLTTIYLILTALILLLWVPGVGMVLPPRAYTQFPLSAVSVWPIAMSVSTLFGVVGTGQKVIDLVGNIWAMEPFTAVGLWIALCIGLAQVASDTGTAGMLIPILTDALPARGIDPVPWIMMTGYSVDLSFMAPTATGTIAVLYALGGRSHFRLPLYGFICAASCGVFSWLFWGLVISQNWQFWSTLDVIK